MFNGGYIDTVTVSPKYQVVIPAPIRAHMKMYPGQKVVVMEKEGVIHIVPISDIKDMKGKMRGLSTEGVRDERDRY